MKYLLIISMIPTFLGHQITENPLPAPHQIEPNKENHDRVAAGHHSVQPGSVVHQAHLCVRTGGAAPPCPLRGRGEAGVGRLVLRLIIREVVERTDHLLPEIDQVKTATYILIDCPASSGRHNLGYVIVIT